jgi:gamma-glutamyl:cysteine ligase YbdK (ATP-grasp superfamily)
VSALRQYGFFEVTGIELEYPTVDLELRPRCLVEPLFRRLAGRAVSEVERGGAVFSNELAAHVFEIKTAAPRRNLALSEKQLVAGLQPVLKTLREEFGARLLPTGMHPFMDPAEGQLWPRAGRAIYQTYAKLFAARGHGWMNVQSCHINLPFGTEEETVLLHNAIACLMPYLPALAASSPIFEGRLGPDVCNRLAFYRANQQRIPEITGKVVPEFMTSYAQYKRDVLQPIYRKLGKIRGGQRLRHEWINSRGAIVRFNRRAIEIRTLDTQECVRMDIAIASFVRAVLKLMVRWLAEGRMALPSHETLVDDFDRAVKFGSEASVLAPHFRPWLRPQRRSLTAVDVLRRLLEECAPEIPGKETQYLPLLDHRLRSGCLSERIRKEVHRRSGRRTGSMPGVIHGIYEELAECLEQNTPWYR